MPHEAQNDEIRNVSVLGMMMKMNSLWEVRWKISDSYPLIHLLLHLSHKILAQLQKQARDLNRDLKKTQAETHTKARELRQAVLTLAELSRLPGDDESDVKVYKPVGKM